MQHAVDQLLLGWSIFRHKDTADDHQYVAPSTQIEEPVQAPTDPLGASCPCACRGPLAMLQHDADCSRS